eukprot:Gb_04507 [translate_table: standard]
MMVSNMKELMLALCKIAYLFQQMNRNQRGNGQEVFVRSDTDFPANPLHAMPIAEVLGMNCQFPIRHQKNAVDRLAGERNFESTSVPSHLDPIFRSLSGSPENRLSSRADDGQQYEGADAGNTGVATIEPLQQIYVIQGNLAIVAGKKATFIGFSDCLSSGLGRAVGAIGNLRHIDTSGNMEGVHVGKYSPIDPAFLEVLSEELRAEEYEPRPCSYKGSCHPAARVGESELARANALGHFELDNNQREALIQSNEIGMLKSGQFRFECAALEALQNLSPHEKSKKQIAKAGGVPLLPDFLKKPVVVMKIGAAAILVDFTTKHGVLSGLLLECDLVSNNPLSYILPNVMLLTGTLICRMKEVICVSLLLGVMAVGVNSFKWKKVILHSKRATHLLFSIVTMSKSVLTIKGGIPNSAALILRYERENAVKVLLVESRDANEFREIIKDNDHRLQTFLGFIKLAQHPLQNHAIQLVLKPGTATAKIWACVALGNISKSTPRLTASRMGYVDNSFGLMRNSVHRMYFLWAKFRSDLFYKSVCLSEELGSKSAAVLIYMEINSLQKIVVTTYRSQFSLMFSLDMAAHSACNFGGGKAEKLALAKYRQVLWQGRVLNSQFSDEELRNQGRCPLTPEEIGLLLAALGFGNRTRLYLASHKVYGGEARISILRQLFPLMEDKKSLATEEELSQLEGKASLSAAVDYYVSMQSDIFISASPGNMHNALVIPYHKAYLCSYLLYVARIWLKNVL